VAQFVLDSAANPRRDGAVVCRRGGAYLLKQLGWEADRHGGREPAASWSLGLLIFGRA